MFEGIGVACIAQGFRVGVVFLEKKEDVVFGDGGEGGRVGSGGF